MIRSLVSEETRRKLRELNLYEMVEALEFQEHNTDFTSLSFEERMGLLVDVVYEKKHNDKVKRLKKGAKFRISNASTHSIYYGNNRGLDKNQILSLSSCKFLYRNANVVFHGFTGSGKTYLACALGNQACSLGIRTRYIRMSDLMILRDEASLEALGIPKLIKKMARYELLIIDEWLFDDLSAQDHSFIFELIELRHNVASTIFCTQRKKGEWHESLGGGIHADAIMDRIVHNANWVFAGTLNMRELMMSKEMLT